MFEALPATFGAFALIVSALHPCGHTSPCWTPEELHAQREGAGAFSAVMNLNEWEEKHVTQTLRDVDDSRTDDVIRLAQVWTQTVLCCA